MGASDRVFLVVCGSTRVTLDELTEEALALDVALAHDRVHHCSPWVQVPFESLRDDDDPRA